MRRHVADQVHAIRHAEVRRHRAKAVLVGSLAGDGKMQRRATGEHGDRRVELLQRVEARDRADQRDASRQAESRPRLLPADLDRLVLEAVRHMDEVLAIARRVGLVVAPRLVGIDGDDVVERRAARAPCRCCALPDEIVAGAETWLAMMTGTPASRPAGAPKMLP